LREQITACRAADLARLLKALADPTRLRLVSLVAARDGGEACVCDLTGPPGLTQHTISYHLKILAAAGIFTRDKRGVRACYALAPAALNALAAVLSTASQDPGPAFPGSSIGTCGRRPPSPSRNASAMPARRATRSGCRACRPRSGGRWKGPALRRYVAERLPTCRSAGAGRSRD
jgi:ArsR family transcriptional regulator, arsenate/arsenite/antimonite-responsive transcriptional repressor